MSDHGYDFDRMAAKAAGRAHAAFVRAGWTYGGTTSEKFAPSEGYLAVTIRRLLENTIEFDKGEGSTGTGRLHVDRYEQDGHDCYTVSLELANLSFPLEGDE